MSNTSGSEGLTVQVLVGPPALSQFALQRVQRHAPNVVYAEFVHLLQVASPLAGEALERAEGLLRYGPQQQMPEPQGHHSHTILPGAAPFRPGRARLRIYSLCRVWGMLSEWSAACVGSVKTTVRSVQTKRRCCLIE